MLQLWGLEETAEQEREHAFLALAENGSTFKMPGLRQTFRSFRTVL